MAEKVYFTKDISPESVIKMYETVGKKLEGNVAVKVHSGEKGNQNFLRPEFWKPMIDTIGGRVVETNTNYGGARDNTKDHRATISLHGWDRYFDVDIMDEEGDMAIPVPNGVQMKANLVGTHLANYDSMLVLAHFKGHPAAGYGGAIKQLSIGCASHEGKRIIHIGNMPNVELWSDECFANQTEFQRAMADAACSVVNFFKGNIVYINVMKNISVDCDCCAVAEDPCMKDIGVLASTDPIAIDRACLDLIHKAVDDPGQAHFLERVNSRNGEYLIEAADALGFGSSAYEFVNLD